MSWRPLRACPTLRPGQWLEPPGADVRVSGVVCFPRPLASPPLLSCDPSLPLIGVDGGVLCVTVFQLASCTAMPPMCLRQCSCLLARTTATRTRWPSWGSPRHRRATSCGRCGSRQTSRFSRACRGRCSPPPTGAGIAGRGVVGGLDECGGVCAPQGVRRLHCCTATRLSFPVFCKVLLLLWWLML